MTGVDLDDSLDGVRGVRVGFEVIRLIFGRFVKKKKEKNRDFVEMTRFEQRYSFRLSSWVIIK